MKPGKLPAPAEAGLPRLAVFLLALCQFLCPLVFFTDLTRNPYFTQIVLLNVFVLAALALWAFRREPAARLAAPDVPFLAWIAVCALSLFAAWWGNSAFFRPSILREGLRNLGFIIVNCAAVYFLARLVRWEDRPFDKKLGGVYALILWGALWAVYPDMRASVSPGGILDRMLDPYGTILWLGAGAAIFAFWKTGAVGDFLHLALAASAVSAGYGILQFFGAEWIWPRILNPYGSRSVATFGNPNFLSSYLVMLLPLTLVYYLRQEKTVRRVFYAALFLLFEASLLCSLTRSSWLGAGIALLLLLILPRCRALLLSSRKALLWLALPALLLVLLWPSSSMGDYHPTVSQRVSELKGVSSSAMSWDGQVYGPWHQRLLIWSSSAGMGFESPLLGRGCGLLELFYPFYQGPYLYAYKGARLLRTHANNAHNEIIEHFSQTGILGLGLYAWLICALFAAAWKFSSTAGQQDDRAVLVWVLACGLAGMLADNMLNVSIHFAVPAFLFWWMSGTVAGAGQKPGGREFRPGRRAALALSAVFLLGCAVWYAQWMREVRYFRGFKLLRGNENAAAIRELEKSDWWGREVNSSYERAIAYLKSGDTDRAAQGYRDAMTANAGYDELYHNLGVALSGKPESRADAITALETAEWINPLNKATHIALSELYLRDENASRTKALAHMRRALNIFPNDLGFRNKLAYLYAKSGDYKSAAAEFKTGLELNPFDQTLYGNYLRALADMKERPGDFAGFINRIQRARDLLVAQPQSSATAAELSALYRDFPNNPHVRVLAARLYFVQKRYDKAMEILNALLHEEPDNLNALFALATVCEGKGDSACARSALQHVLSVDPGNESAVGRLRSLRP